MYPKYEFPRRLFVRVAVDMLLGRRRDFRLDASACIRSLQPPLRVLGAEHIPARGPCLLVMNHYARPGFAVWWLSMAVSSLLPAQHAWMIAARWTAPDQWYEPLKELYSGFVSRRLAHTYGFLRMPPMPPRPQETLERAAAVRAALRYVEHTPEAVLCLAPEGRDMPEGRLGMPPEGVGRFISWLASRGLPLLPAGGWEQAGALTVRFGPPYRLEERLLPESGRPGQRDHNAARIVMQSIACLLPESLRGEFA
jgi:1-acyl-sn-glycerol-3-phosphate acyltransferase